MNRLLHQCGPRQQPTAWWAGLLLVYLLSGVYVVRPRQAAVVRCFGAVVGPAAGPGLHWRPPWPTTRLSKVNLREAKRVSIGVALEDQVLKASPPAPVSEFLTGDENIVHVGLVVQYDIASPAAYLFTSADPAAFIARAGEVALTRAVAATPVDEALTTGRAAIQQEVLRQAQAALADEYGLGVQLLSAKIRVATPPPQVADAFRGVESARADRDRLISQAQGYANDLIPKAEGEAAQMGEQARGDAKRIVAAAQGEASRFTDLVNEYRRSPDVTRRRLHLEMAEEVVPQMKVVVVDDRHGRQPLDLGIIRPQP